MNAIVWPDKPVCHGDSPRFAHYGVSWRAPGEETDPRYPSPYRETFRTCSYCGSIHPEDLLAVVSQGATLGGSDWKYGWPHKFYVGGIPNPIAGQLYTQYSYCGSPSKEMLATGKWERYQDGFSESTGEPKYSYREATSTRGCPPTQHAKWYNEHLLDLSAEAFAVVTPVLLAKAHIEFQMEDGKLKYRALSHSYQA